MVPLVFFPHISSDFLIFLSLSSNPIEIHYKSPSSLLGDQMTPRPRKPSLFFLFDRRSLVSLIFWAGDSQSLAFPLVVLPFLFLDRLTSFLSSSWILFPIVLRVFFFLSRNARRAEGPSSSFIFFRCSTGTPFGSPSF